MTPIDLATYHEPAPEEQARRHHLRRQLVAYADALDAAALERALAAVVAVVAQGEARR